ncbi:DNA polymerase family A-domain-containing protein [Suillus occidentalis]|nr:DNA polymerase family A-domain-containing protein [Suillus occidentalis]
MLNLVRKPNGSARHLHTSTRAAALVQKQKEHYDHVQPRPVIGVADVKKGRERERERDVVKKVVKHVKRNELGVQLLSRELHSQIFRDSSFPAPSKAFVRIAQEHLEMHGLDPKQGSILPDIGFTLPPLLGSNIDEHFHRIGNFASNELPPKPDHWEIQSGWTKYYFLADGSSYSEHVESPQHEGNAEEVLTFDVETMPSYHPYAIMACAASKNAWYSWISPWLLGESTEQQHLIPLGDTLSPRVVVGHNVCYDRARILEEYSLHGTQSRFLDTMALHVAVNGISSHQRPAWMKHRKSKETQKVHRAEAVEAVIELMRDAEFKHDQEDDEIKREELRPDLSSKRWEDLTSANSLADEVRNDFMKLTPKEIKDNIHDYLNYCAQDVFVTHAVFSKVLPAFLDRCPSPVSFAWHSCDGFQFLDDRVYKELDGKVKKRLVELAEQAKDRMEDESWKDDPWLSQLDWTPKVAGKSRGVMPAEQWYWDLAKPKKDMPPGTLDVTVRNRIAPILLCLSWQGWPLFHSREHGWTFRVPGDADFPTRFSQLDFHNPADDILQDMRLKQGFVFYKLPHKDGEKANVGSPLGKTFMKFAQDGTLTSPGDEAKDALDMNAQCSYWISARDRILNQMVVWQRGALDLQFEPPGSSDEPQKWGIILPQVITMGTVTRRAIERTWLTASNAKKNRVGSELKAMVRAPKGYAIVGADVDSEELWISSCMGDAQFGLHDLHSKTASILGISRDQAKVFNYSRIYGAGMPQGLAENLYASTKGKNTHRTDLFGRKFWFGGTESFVFNKLEEIALSDQPRTPALGCGITAALSKELLPAKFDNMVSRHVISSRCTTELRYLVAEEDRYRAALALQIANLWTRSLFAFKLGMDDLPQGVAFFSAVDIDKVLRKEVDMPCVTPSHPNPIPSGESLDIAGILNKTNSGSLWKDGHSMIADSPPSKASGQHNGCYEPPSCLIHRAESAAWLRAQATSEFSEIKHLAQQTSGQVIDIRIRGTQSDSVRLLTLQRIEKILESRVLVICGSIDIIDNGYHLSKPTKVPF